MKIVTIKISEAVCEIFNSDINSTRKTLKDNNCKYDTSETCVLFMECLYDLIAKQVWRLMNKTFVYEFHQYRIKHSLTLTANSTIAYDGYVDNLSKETISGWFSKYRVLHKLVESCIKNSCQYIIEVHKRFTKDKELLVKNKFMGKNSKLIRVYSLDSDPHNKGKVVLCFETSNEDRFLYKSRDYSIDKLVDEIFNEVLDLDELEVFSPIPKSIAMTDYGWQQYIFNLPIQRASVGEAFYNLGMYSALFSSLGATDLHDENIIFEETKPYFIDLETVMQPSIQNFGTTLLETINKKLSETIANTSIIPAKLLSGSFNYLIGAINTPYPQETSETVFTFKNIGTDALDIAKEKVKVDRLANPIVCKDGDIIDPVPFQNNFIQGYEKGYREIIIKKNEIIKKLKKFKGGLRVVLRPTTQYFLLTDACLYPENLVDITSINKVLKYLKPISFLKNSKAATFFYEEECKSLLEGDIPYFYIDADKRNLKINKYSSQDIYEGSPIENALENLKRVNEDSLTLDIRLISEGFSEIKIKNSLVTNKQQDNSKMFLELLSTLNSNDLNKVLNFFKSLSIEYVEEKKNYKVWLNGIYGDLPISYNSASLISFHDSGGMVLMLKNLANILKNKDSQDLARQSIRGIKKLKKEIYGNSLYKDEHVSVISGESSLDYILNNNKDRNIDIENLLIIKENNILLGDVFSGKIGLYLLIATYKKLNKLVLDNAILDFSNIPQEFSKFGLAHGELGILWTKFRVYAKIGELKKCYGIYTKALEYINYDSNLQTGWCNGYSGLLMILTEMSTILSDNKDFFNLALKSTELSDSDSVDLSVCHGASGVVQSLLFCYIVRNDKRYLTLAEGYWGHVYATVVKNGFHTGEPNRDYLFGYLLGWSGIIDTQLLLEQVKKDKIPWIPINMSSLSFQKSLQGEIKDEVISCIKS